MPGRSRCTFSPWRKSYFAEIPFHASVWDDVLVPLARLVWADYRSQLLALSDRDQGMLPQGAYTLFYSTILAPQLSRQPQ